MKLRLLVLALGSLLSFGSFGQTTANYPNKTVRIVVPFAAGGATDIVTRILAQKLNEVWGESVVVDNRGGAGGNIGAVEVVKAAPDGYTLLMTSGSVVTANQHIYKNMGFDPKADLMPITMVSSGPQVVVVNPNLPVQTLKELIELAKAKPGTLNYGHAGIGSQTHLAAENFLYATGPEHSEHSVQGRRTGYHRPGCGADQHGDAERAGGDRIYQWRKAARAGSDRQGALAGVTQCAHRSGNRSGVRKHRMVRIDGAGRHAAAGHRQDLSRRGQSTRHDRYTRSLFRAGNVADAVDAECVCHAHSERDRALGHRRA